MSSYAPPTGLSVNKICDLQARNGRWELLLLVVAAERLFANVEKTTGARRVGC